MCPSHIPHPILDSTAQNASYFHCVLLEPNFFPPKCLLISLGQEDLDMWTHGTISLTLWQEISLSLAPQEPARCWPRLPRWAVGVCLTPVTVTHTTILQHVHTLEDDDGIQVYQVSSVSRWGQGGFTQTACLEPNLSLNLVLVLYSFDLLTKHSLYLLVAQGFCWGRNRGGYNQASWVT